MWGLAAVQVARTGRGRGVPAQPVPRSWSPVPWWLGDGRGRGGAGRRRSCFPLGSPRVRLHTSPSRHQCRLAHVPFPPPTYLSRHRNQARYVPYVTPSRPGCRVPGRCRRWARRRRLLGLVSLSVLLPVPFSFLLHHGLSPVRWCPGACVSWVPRGTYAYRDHSPDHARTGIPLSTFCGTSPYLTGQHRREGRTTGI